MTAEVIRPNFTPGSSLIEKARQVHLLLTSAFGSPAWNAPVSPLDELISTILSQNTNDTNRDRAYVSLRKAFPTWEEVRDAAPGEIINAIQVAGLANQKGPRIQVLLRQITEARGNLDLSFLKSLSPEEIRSWLLQFNGVGPKTAAIVMVFSLGFPAFPVDTHVYRVTGRLGLRPGSMDVIKTHPLMERLFQPEDFGVDHMNIIRLGREICKARNPECGKCPLVSVCDFNRDKINQ
jgi:endonuclease-3